MQISIYKAQDEPIGKGGMGNVYLASDPNGNKVAIKELRPEFVADANMRARFHKEIELMDRFNHPSIVKMHASFDWNESLYVVMEYIDGVTLEKYVQTKGRLIEEEAVAILLNILDALAYAHNLNIVHRDIKPSNIMIRKESKNICLLDFGIAKDLNSKGLTFGYLTIGTNGYMSPEQVEGYNINHLSDIYSLGCLLYYMLTGQHAFTKQVNDVATQMAIINNKFPKAKDKNPNLSDRIQQILDKATDKDMRLRFQSCNEFAKEIQNNSGTIILESNVNPKISIGRSNCDINIYDPERKVSTHHADIEKVPVTGGYSKYIFIDRSTNGTLINGLKIHNQKKEVWIDPHNYLSSFKKMPYPEIYLACLSKYQLNWNEVIGTFNSPANNENFTKSAHYLNPSISQESSSILYADNNLSIGWTLISLLIPIVGWVQYYQWKKVHPIKAKKIATVAWIGFVLSLVFNLIINIP